VSCVNCTGRGLLVRHAQRHGRCAVSVCGVERETCSCALRSHTPAGTEHPRTSRARDSLPRRSSWIACCDRSGVACCLKPHCCRITAGIKRTANIHNMARMSSDWYETSYLESCAFRQFTQAGFGAVQGAWIAACMWLVTAFFAVSRSVCGPTKA
jgi:hypothetical protein